MSGRDELKIDRADYTCEQCYRSFHTESGLERHQERDACVEGS